LIPADSSLHKNRFFRKAIPCPSPVSIANLNRSHSAVWNNCIILYYDSIPPTVMRSMHILGRSHHAVSSACFVLLEAKFIKPSLNPCESIANNHNIDLLGVEANQIIRNVTNLV
jgi:hypothetical protein